MIQFPVFPRTVEVDGKHSTEIMLPTQNKGFICVDVNLNNNFSIIYSFCFYLRERTKQDLAWHVLEESSLLAHQIVDSSRSLTSVKFNVVIIA